MSNSDHNMSGNFYLRILLQRYKQCRQTCWWSMSIIDLEFVRQISQSLLFSTFSCSHKPGVALDSSNVGQCNSQVCRTVNPCENNGTCSENNGTLSCVCQSGFYGDLCQHSQQKGSCDTSPCQNSGTCIQQADTYTCLCSIDRTGPTCLQSQGEIECLFSNLKIIISFSKLWSLFISMI